MTLYTLHQAYESQLRPTWNPLYINSRPTSYKLISCQAYLYQPDAGRAGNGSQSDRKWARIHADEVGDGPGEVGACQPGDGRAGALRFRGSDRYG